MRYVLVLVLAGAAACGDGHPARPDAPGGGDAIDAPADVAVDMMIDANPDMPATLFDTGLCVDRACTQISPGIYAYTPRFGLWVDGATKRRWMQLPPGGHIDTTDPDHWVFPIGTKFWKEFTSQDGMGNPVRVETRFIKHVANNGDQNDWFYVGYQWNATQDDTTAQPFGLDDVDGTQHDIPPRFQCRECHEGVSSRILGFGAIQLDAPAAQGDIALADLVSMGWLTQNPTGSSPYYPLPGTAGSSAQNALGYLHANCGHCHNPQSQVYQSEGITMELRLTVGSLGSLATTPVYQTAVDHDATLPIDGLTKRIVSGDPAHSILIDRFDSLPTASIHMPFRGSEVIDATAQAMLHDWITNLQ